MKNFTLLLLLFCTQFICVKAQNDEGMSIGEALMQKNYPQDSIAEASILNDIGRSYFETDNDGNFNLYFERKTITKIYKKAGLKWGEIEIPFYVSNDGIEQIYEIDGKTYNLENGAIKTTPLVINKRYEEKIDNNWRVLKFAMPDLKEGSVFVLSYKISSPFLFNLRSWDFQYKIPVKYSEYSTHMNPFYEYIYILQNTNKLSGFNSYVDNSMSRRFAGIEYKDMVYEFIMADLPAFRDESYISSANDYMIKLNFQLSKIHYTTGNTRQIMSSWDNLSRDMLGSDGYAGFLGGAQKKAVKIVETMQFNTTDLKEKTRIIERYVKENFSWDGEISKYTDSRLNDFLTTRRGNSAEINLFLIGMLRAAGIEATPVLVSTRGHGKIYSNYPFLHFFNNVIALIKNGDEKLALDATDPLSNFGEIPIYCFNDRGLVLNKKEPEWITLKNPGNSNSTYTLELNPDPVKHNIAGKIKIETTGYDALRLRDQYHTDFKKFKKDIMSSAFKLSDTIRTGNLDKFDQSFDINYSADIPMGYIGNKLIIAPFCYMALTENLLKQVSRTYPIDMIYRNSKKYCATVRIPAGYKLFSKPEDLTYSNNMGKISFTTEVLDDQTLKISGSYEFAKDIYNAEEYAELKGFFNKIIDKFNEKVICIKS